MQQQLGSNLHSYTASATRARVVCLAAASEYNYANSPATRSEQTRAVNGRAQQRRSLMAEQDLADRIWRAAENAVVGGDAVELDRLLQEHDPLRRPGTVKSSWSGGLAPDSPDARSIITTEHCFSNWNEFVAFKGAVSDTRSAIAQFEEAVDAVVAGHIARLEELLRAAIVAGTR
jgi:hypothetical protein